MRLGAIQEVPHIPVYHGTMYCVETLCRTGPACVEPGPSYVECWGPPVYRPPARVDLGLFCVELGPLCRYVYIVS